ncbi:MAG: ATP-binding cassette domain-containing protein, partial [Actinobacteria bacterium]|nr:ATP-binding cassette domain-containing protein [Actinomycetota bacterium]
MIAASGIELRAGAQLLLGDASFRVGKGDRVGLVGRNGAGKTTLTRALAGETIPAKGTISSSGTVGYLPQDPSSGNPDELARDRILSARGLHEVVRRMQDASMRMDEPDEAERERIIARYARAEAEFEALGGYAVESEAATIAASVGLPDRVLSQPLGTLSGGQRRRVELARILFSGADVLLLDEPTNHLDADSVRWLRKFLSTYDGGFIVISHDTALLEDTVNKVWHLDANRRE